MKIRFEYLTNKCVRHNIHNIVNAIINYSYLKFDFFKKKHQSIKKKKKNLILHFYFNLFFLLNNFLVDYIIQE